MNNSLKINGVLQSGPVYFFINRLSSQIISLFFILFFSVFCSVKISAQDNIGLNSGDPDSSASNTSSNTNFDGRMLAGLNGDSMFSISMTQGLKNFAYQLNSDFSNNNDFEDYSNSGFTTHQSGFTGEISLSDYWKIIPEFEISSSSYGMFENPYYSRENNDKTTLRLKNEYKPVPARWDIDLNYSRYDHVLKETDTSFVKEDTTHAMQGVIGMEYIWSASNKMGLISENGYNKYPELYEEDAYSNNDLYFSFKITEYTMLTAAYLPSWNKDGSEYLCYRADISSINLKYISLELLNERKLVPYNPAEVMYSQKFMSDVFDLPPATINHTEFKCEFEGGNDNESDAVFGIRRAALKLAGIYERNNNFYNYYPLNGREQDILSAEAMPANYFNGRAEFVTTFIIFTQVIDIDFRYDYYSFEKKDSYEDVNITYRPENIYTCNISYAGSWLEINWENSYKDKVYVDPADDRRLKSSILGTLDIHLKLHDTLYLHSRIINLYNEEYSYREGYPEPGVQLFAGLRVII